MLEPVGGITKEFQLSLPSFFRYIMSMMFPLSAYIDAALELASYDKLDDGSFSGEIPKLKGVVAFGLNLKNCEQELRSTLEDWLLVGLRLGHKIPVLAGIDLNKVASHGRMETSQKA